MVLHEMFWPFFLQKHKVPIVIDIWVNLEQFWIGLWGSKIALKCWKMKKWPKNLKIVKTDVLEQFLRVRYALSMNFIDLLKKNMAVISEKRQTAICKWGQSAVFAKNGFGKVRTQLVIVFSFYKKKKHVFYCSLLKN